MKNILIYSLIISFSLTGCQTTTNSTPQPQTENLKKNIDETSLSNFQLESADFVAKNALTIEEIKNILPENMEVTEETGKERTGFGGKVFNVNVNDETVMVISYFTFDSKDAMEENYKLLYESSQEKKELDFSQNAFLSVQHKKIIFINKFFKFDIRFVGLSDEYYSEEMMEEIAKKAYNKSV